MFLGQLMIFLGVQQGYSVPIIMTGWTVSFLASGVAMAMPFAVLSDSVDYGEWKTGIRAAGLLTEAAASGPPVVTTSWVLNYFSAVARAQFGAPAARAPAARGG